MNTTMQAKAHGGLFIDCDEFCQRIVMVKASFSLATGLYAA